MCDVMESMRVRRTVEARTMVTAMSPPTVAWRVVAEIA